ncbi:MAG: FAD-binding and (Fe-S)-binding domain-containing protein [Spirosomataceae bacterium]
MNYLQDLHTFLPPERIKARLIDRYAYASDASHFFLVPKAVVQPCTIAEIQQLFQWAHRHRMPLTFRTGGTSLSGQASTDNILVDLSRFWRKAQPENNGLQLRVEPSVIGANANLVLKKYGRKIGPDPASINACMLGGILSNNSSGMCCGVQYNAYHTMKSIRFVLPNGLIFNTEEPTDYARFEAEVPQIAQGLTHLRSRVLANATLTDRIRSKYKQKNTVGYSLNAFVDYEHPLDILAHLLIGAEGTLAFIAEAVLHTLPDLPHKITGMLYFESPEAAGYAIPQMKATKAEALEFMDRPSLRSVENMEGVPPILQTLPERAAAILVEFQANTLEAVQQLYQDGLEVFNTFPLIVPPQFTQQPDEQAMLWKIRKGLYPSAAGIRAKKTSAMMEDLNFPTERLGEAIVDIQRLFAKYGYHDGIVFGHIKDGNLHFCLAQNFSEPSEVKRFTDFHDEIFELVLHKYDGALKAEHGTGRAVAPYVEASWGPEAYQIMQELKALIDPHRVLNPGIILSQDKNIHLRDLKKMPIVEDEVDKCVECGFCERRCPSRDFTMTPRQRISVRRSLKRLADAGQTTAYQAIWDDYQFSGLDTCAVDGMCATDCPVSINTGLLVKRLRQEKHSDSEQRRALMVATNFKWVEKSARWALQTGFFFNSVFGKNFMSNLTQQVKRLAPSVPLWSKHLSPPASVKTSSLPNEATTSTSLRILYFSSCITRMMGGDAFQTIQRVCHKANVQLLVPEDIAGTCCGQVFSSKGFTEAYRFTANQTIQKLWHSSQQGQIPVVLDGTSCTQTLKTSRPYLSLDNQQRFDQLQILDSIDFAADILLPRLHITNIKKRIVFHPVCSVSKMNLLGKIQQIGKACALEADIPALAGCCGMAGDRGFYFPALTQAATKAEAQEVNIHTYDGYYSSGKTCEMALSEAVGHRYESILKLLDDVSVASNQ